MMRQWIKILVLVAALLSQVAMSCQTSEQTGGNANPPTAPQGSGY